MYNNKTWGNLDIFRFVQRRVRQGPTRHIVLDMDETLVRTFSGLDKFKTLRLYGDPNLVSLRKRIYITDDHHHWGVTRPHIDEFLISCLEQFTTVSVWSAGTRGYVESVVEYLFRQLPPPDRVLAREQCVIEDGIYKKPIEVINRYIPDVTYENTLIVEDRSTALDDNSSRNGVIIPPYKPMCYPFSLVADDTTLLTLASWFREPSFEYANDLRFVPRPTFDRHRVSVRIRIEPLINQSTNFPIVAV